MTLSPIEGTDVKVKAAQGFASLEEAAAAGYRATTSAHGPNAFHAVVEGPGVRVRVHGETRELAFEQTLESLNATLRDKQAHTGTDWGSRH